MSRAATPANRVHALDVERIRADFPALQQTVHGKPLAYLDNAATAQKPASVIEALAAYYRHDNANIHRGVHALSERATAAYESAREKVRRFINAGNTRELVFVRGTTEAINLVAQTFGRTRIGKGDEILITHMEHHSNIVPWQLLCRETGAILRVAPINQRGELDMDAFASLIGPRTRLVAVGHVSNALGTVNPVREIVRLAHDRDVPVLVDGAQAVPHMPVDVRDLDCDFYAFSGHKMFGPTGVGCLYVRESILSEMPPWQGGGEMIKMVSFDRTVYNDLPHRFEAGTPNIAGAIGLGATVDYLTGLDMNAVAAMEADLLDHGTRLLSEIPGVRLVGTAAEKAGVLSFVVEGVHPHDLGTILDHEGIAIRAGHHCAMPVMDFFGVPATARASLAFYNTREELDRLAGALQKAKEVFA